MNRKLLDFLYLELFTANEDAKRLEAEDTFALCIACGESLDMLKTHERLTAAKQRAEFASKVIDLVCNAPQ